MQTFDIHHGITLGIAKAGASIPSGAGNGEIIDTAGFESLEFLFQVGPFTSIAPVVILQHGDESDLSDATEVDAEEVLGSFANVPVPLAVGKVGYIGKKQYVRIRQEAGQSLYIVIAVLGNAHTQPTADI